MQTNTLDYDLPPELIAQTPADQRSASRLLVMNRKTAALRDRGFADIADCIEPGDCLVLNNTKVTPARFFARKATGARLEGLFLEADATGRWVVMLKNSRRVKPHERIIFCDRGESDWGEAEAVERLGDGRWRLSVKSDKDALTILNEIGFAPLPPYIKRDADAARAKIDLGRYQTVYASRPGAVAAPTAGLHFTEALLEQLEVKGVRRAHVTLHVGAGTFKPVTADRLEDHQMHSEHYEVKAADAEIINETMAQGGRIVAVGTTSVRTLETLAQGRHISAGVGQTALFIRPGYEFQVVDAIITNFHLPRSTLLALVAAFAGLENVLSAYRHAVEQRYRFFSYGDAMLIV
ncbi:MAG: tRNA preQ1(34) S-adenosylmethionine ribosyltransferase-isomerase QueA [Phycisphaerae bacterium]|nr:tRNA preQ1(34) S-adenosylmethionine ribosyltransferase-isomerase QueA [Phycisphaerae bacterium]